MRNEILRGGFMRGAIMDELHSKISGEAERVHSDWLVLELTCSEVGCFTDVA